MENKQIIISKFSGESGILQAESERTAIEHAESSIELQLFEMGCQNDTSLVDENLNPVLASDCLIVSPLETDDLKQVRT